MTALLAQCVELESFLWCLAQSPAFSGPSMAPPAGLSSWSSSLSDTPGWALGLLQMDRSDDTVPNEGVKRSPCGVQGSEMSFSNSVMASRPLVTQLCSQTFQEHLASEFVPVRSMRSLQTGSIFSPGSGSVLCRVPGWLIPAGESSWLTPTG